MGTAHFPVPEQRATDDRLNKLYTDMYYGEGKDNPPMTVRVDRLEKSVEEMVSNSKSTRLMMVGTMLTVVGGIVIAFLTHILGWKP